MRLTYPLAALCALALLAPSGRARDEGDDFFDGWFTLVGEDDQGRVRQTKLRIEVERPPSLIPGHFDETRVTVWRKSRARTLEGWEASSHWRSARVETPKSRVMEVTWEVDTPAVTSGIASRLTGSPPGAEPKRNVFKAVYTLSEDGKHLREVLTNTTGHAPETWRSIESTGRRFELRELSDKALTARVDQAAREWHAAYTNEVYAHLLKTATSDAERARLETAAALDREFATSCRLGGDSAMERGLDGIYTSERLDGELGREVPREDLRVFSLRFTPSYAGVELKKVFVFDGMTGQLVYETPVRHDGVYWAHPGSR